MSEHDEDNRPRSTADKLLAQREERKDHIDVAIENREEYKKALNAIAASPSGEYVFKYMIKALGVFAVKPNRDGVALVGDKALRDFYLTMIRPYLDADIRHKLED